MAYKVHFIITTFCNLLDFVAKLADFEP